MKLSAPIHILKSRAKELKRSRSITMTEALNEVAKTEGYSSWGLLQAKAKGILPKKKEDILGYLNPGDLMLIGARPGMGKTSFTLEILVQASRKKRKCYFFSLEYTHKDVASKVASLDENISQNNEYVTFNFSDEISAKYIIDQVKGHVSEWDIIAIDYLQLLDQKRTNPELQEQVKNLKQFARSVGCIIIFVSQVDRSFDNNGNNSPEIEDIRLPNPVDVELFNKMMFIHKGKKTFSRPAQFEVN